MRGTRNRGRIFCRELMREDYMRAVRFAYTGTYMYELLYLAGIQYGLIVLLTSGVLTFEQPYIGDVWLCGGGAGGKGGYDSTSLPRPGRGGCGGYAGSAYGVLLEDPLNATVGTGGKGGYLAAAGQFPTTTPGTGGSSRLMRVTDRPGYPRIIASASGGGQTSGGSGGGGVGSYRAGDSQPYFTEPTLGAGASTVPFDDLQNFTPYCGGGAGGNYAGAGSVFRGGNGGSNGQNGSAAVNITGSPDSYAQGGYQGGGSGAPGDGDISVRNATLYGGGGAGGNLSGTDAATLNGGDGYQGVIYIRIPYEEI